MSFLIFSATATSPSFKSPLFTWLKNHTNTIILHSMEEKEEEEEKQEEEDEEEEEK